MFSSLPYALNRTFALSPCYYRKARSFLNSIYYWSMQDSESNCIIYVIKHAIYTLVVCTLERRTNTYHHIPFDSQHLSLTTKATAPQIYANVIIKHEHDSTIFLWHWLTNKTKYHYVKGNLRWYIMKGFNCTFIDHICQSYISRTAFNYHSFMRYTDHHTFNYHSFMHYNNHHTFTHVCIMRH